MMKGAPAVRREAHAGRLVPPSPRWRQVRTPPERKGSDLTPKGSPLFDCLSTIHHEFIAMAYRGDVLEFGGHSRRGPRERSEGRWGRPAVRSCGSTTWIC